MGQEEEQKEEKVFEKYKVNQKLIDLADDESHSFALLTCS